MQCVECTRRGNRYGARRDVRSLAEARRGLVWSGVGVGRLFYLCKVVELKVHPVRLRNNASATTAFSSSILRINVSFDTASSTRQKRRRRRHYLHFWTSHVSYLWCQQRYFRGPFAKIFRLGTPYRIEIRKCWVVVIILYNYNIRAVFEAVEIRNTPRIRTTWIAMLLPNLNLPFTN